MKTTMPLELSDSEAFWLAIACRKMEHLKIGDDQGKECEYGIDVDAHPEPYNELLDLAVEFGIATPPQTERLPPDHPPPPADTNWFIGLKPLSTEDLRGLSADFRKTMNESRVRLSALADDGKSVDAFEDHCSTALVGICGHSRSNPSVFYGMTGDGGLPWKS